VTARPAVTLDLVLERLGAHGRLGPVPPSVRPDVPWAPAGTELPATSSAAVLVALFEDRGDVRTILTRRAARLRSHRGEVCFPGGRLDPGEDAVGAALREAREEIGLDPASVEVVGWLQPVVTRSTSSHITPVVARLAGRPALAPNATEVARAFDLGLAEMAGEGVLREERWSLPGPGAPPTAPGTRTYPVWFFEIDGETIWGATARIVHELLTFTVPGFPSAVPAEPSP